MPEDVEEPPILSRVIVGVGWLTGWRMVSRLLGFASVLVLTQILMPKDFGIVAVAFSVSAAADALSQVGVRDALVRLKDDVEAFYDTAFTFQAIRGLLTGTVIALLSTRAQSWFGEPRLQPLLLVLAGSAVISGLENIGIVKLARELDFRTQVLLQQVGPRLIGFFITTILALLLRSYWALIIGTVVSRILGVVLTYSTSPHFPRFRLKGWRYLLHFSFWTWAGSIALACWSRSDAFILGPVLGTTLLGVYVVAFEIAILPVTELIEPISGALYSVFSLAQRTGNNSGRAVYAVAGALLLCATPFAIGISACSGFLVMALLGPKWEIAQPVVAVGSWLCIFSPFSYTFSTALTAQGYLKRAFYCNAFGALVRISACLVARYSLDVTIITAAVSASVVVESSLFLWQMRSVTREGLHALTMTAVRVIFSGSLTAFGLFFLPGTWETTALDRISALVHGGIIGLGTIICFFLIQLFIWNVAGRPEGAETIIIRVLRKVLTLLSITR